MKLCVVLYGSFCIVHVSASVYQLLLCLSSECVARVLLTCCIPKSLIKYRLPKGKSAVTLACTFKDSMGVTHGSSWL